MDKLCSKQGCKTAVADSKRMCAACRSTEAAYKAGQRLARKQAAAAAAAATALPAAPAVVVVAVPSDPSQDNPHADLGPPAAIETPAKKFVNPGATTAQELQVLPTGDVMLPDAPSVPPELNQGNEAVKQRAPDAAAMGTDVPNGSKQKKDPYAMEVDEERDNHAVVVETPVITRKRVLDPDLRPVQELKVFTTGAKAGSPEAYEKPDFLQPRSSLSINRLNSPNKITEQPAPGFAAGRGPSWDGNSEFISRAISTGLYPQNGT
ncbi:hypothetical protein DFH06DRAFT_53895 [Mycena polygramma]|nr:hypothetical protein DFH06DRAFT_53895 [Mycena polygramma]